MPRRTLITASLLVLLLAVIALLPYLPPVRGLIVDRVTQALADAGIDVTYDSSSGNAWRGVTLEGVSVTGAGSDVDVERLRVGYFLPSLLGGELPLDVSVNGATGNVDLEGILDEVSTPAASGSGRSISVRLRRLDLQDIEVDIEQLPFTLPDTSLRQLAVSQDGTNLLLDGVLLTPDGQAEVSGRYESLTGTAVVQLERADAAIGRHWWDGITAGQVTGELRVRGRVVEGDFVLRDGGVADAGLVATGVGGTVTLRLPIISADLRGTAFGGPVEATGVVNVEARRWEANGTAQPELKAAADWLARSQLPEGLPLDISGDATVDMKVAGWQRFTLDGTATGSGAVESVPLEDLQVAFRLPADRELRADGSALLGGGPVEFAMAPNPRGDRLTVTAQDVTLEAIQAGLGELNATVDIGTGPGGSGTISAGWQGAVGGRNLAAVLDATLDTDGLQGFIRANDDSGLEAEGAFVLADGRLEGRLTSGQLGIDALSPGARVAVAVAGPAGDGLDGLGVTLSVTGDEPVRVTALPDAVSDNLDLRGEVSGTLDLASPGSPAVRGLSGSLGPVTIGGEVVVAPLGGQFDLSVDPISLRLGGEPDPEQTDGDSPLAITASVPASTLTFAQSGLAWNGRIAYRDVGAGPTRLAPGAVDATLTVPSGAPWSLVANSPSGDLVATADPGGFRVDLDALPVVVAGPAEETVQTAQAAATVPGRPPAAAPEPLAAVALSGSVSGGGEAGSQLSIDVVLRSAEAPGDVGTARFQLPGAIDLAGRVDLADSRVSLEGGVTLHADAREVDASQTVGEQTARPDVVAGSPRRVPLEATVAWGGDVPGVTAELVLGAAGVATDGPLVATFDSSSGDFTLGGAFDLGQVTSATDARLTADLRGRVSSTGLSDLSGGATVTGTSPTPFTANLEGDGSQVLVEVDAGNDSLPITASGELAVGTFAALADASQELLTASIGPLEGIAVGLAGANGSGTLEGQNLGPLRVPPVPWTLVASWSGDTPPTATVELDGEPVQLTLVEGGVEIEGRLELPVSYSGERYRLSAAVPGGVARFADLPATPVEGALTHLGGEAEADTRAEGSADQPAAEPQGEVLTVSGTLAELSVNGALPTAQLAPMVPAGTRPTGILTLSGTVAPLDGPRYRADIALNAALPPNARSALPEQLAGRTETVTLTGSVSGVGADVTARLTGNQLTFSYENGILDLAANEARLEPLIGVPGTIDGTLALDAASNWSGSLKVAARLPLGEGDADRRIEETAEQDAPEELDLSESLDDPVQLDLLLVGRGAALAVEAEATGPARSRLAASGTLAPALTLVGDLEAGGGIVSGTLEYSTEAGLTAEFASPELLVEDYLTVPPLTVDVSLADGSALRVSGSGIDVAADLSSGALGGDIDVAFTLLESPARLTAEVGGSLSEPTATAAVTGEGLDIDASGGLDAARAELSLDPNLAATFVPTAAALTGNVSGPVEAVARWRADQGWELRAVATTTMPTPNEALVDLELDVTGEGATYDGELAAYFGGPDARQASPIRIASIAVAGTGGDLDAELDLATIDWRAIGEAFDLDLDLAATGSATVATQPFEAGLDVDLRGTVEGVRVSLSGNAPDDLDLTLDSDDIALTARLSWNEERKAVIEGAVGGQPVTGWLDLSDDLRTGELSLDAPGVKIAAELTTVQPAAPTAQLQRHLALSAALSGTSEAEPAPAEGPFAALARLAGDLTAHLVIEGNAVRLAELEAEVAEVAGLDFPKTPGSPLLTLTAAGSLSPRTAIDGNLHLPPLDETAAFSVSEAGAGREAASEAQIETARDGSLVASLAWQGLDLNYVVTERRFALTGSASLGDELGPYLPKALTGLELRLDGADLTWSPDAGFGGDVTALVDAPALQEYGINGPVVVNGAAGDATPAGSPLVLSAEIGLSPDLEGPSASAAANLTIQLPPDLGSPASMPLVGEVLVDAAFAEPTQRLTASADLGGTFGAPTVHGRLAANGVVEGTGGLSVVDGRLSVDLSGPHVELAAAGDLKEWSATAALRGLPVHEWLPQVTAPTLSLDAAASSGSGGATVSGLRLEAGSSSLTGAATITGGVRVALQAQVDLADLQLGDTRLSGLLRGPMVLTAPSTADLGDAFVTAQLDAANLGVESFDGAVSGVLQVGGKVSDPSVNALLSGSGELRGTLQVNAAPARSRFELRSTLAVAGLSSNLRVAATPEMVSAGGQLRYGDGVLLLSDGPPGIELVGAGRFDGWQAQVAADLDELTASGPLSALSNSLAGTVDLRVGGRGDRPAGEPWLLANVSDVVVAGQELDDLSISSEEPGQQIIAEGRGLALSVSPTDLAWTATVDGQELPGSLVLGLSGRGQGASGHIEGSLSSEAGVSGEAGAESGAALGLDLAFSAALGEAADAALGEASSAALGEEAGAAEAGEQAADRAAAQVTISVSGEALGGRLELAGARAPSGAWSGDVALSGASLAGFALSGNGVLQGQGLVPQAVIATAALRQGETPVSVAGRVSLGGSGVSFDQTAALPLLGAPLRVQGQLVPTFDLTLIAASAGPVAASDTAGLPRGSTRIFATGSGLRAAGEVQLPLGPATVTLDGRGPDGSPRLEVRLTAAPSVAAEAPLVARNLADLAALIGERGLTFSGLDAAHGSLRVGLSPTPSAELDDFGVDLAGFQLDLSGTLTTQGADLAGALRLPLDLPAGAQAAGQELPLVVSTTDGTWSVISDGVLGNLYASFDSDTSALQVDLDLALPTSAEDRAAADGGLSSGAIVGRLTYDPTSGPAGTLALADVSLEPVGIGLLTLNADTSIADGRIGGSATLDTAGGRVTLNGNASLGDLLPGLAEADAPGDLRPSNLELRLRTLALDEFPVVAQVAPHLSGALSGVVQLRGGFLLGQIVAPDLAVGGEPVPASLQLSGPPSNLDAALQLAGSLFTADLGEGRIAGSSRLERFPLDLVAEAFVGPTDVTAFFTGVVRFDLPSTEPAAGYVRLATEELTLERAGVTTRGEVALTYEDRQLSVQQADFGGRGAWQAQGVLGPDLLDFTLEANEADFSPLIGLVPALSRFAVGAAGSFTFSAQGDFASPEVTFDSDLLEVTVAGNRFRIEGTDVSLIGDELAASTTIRGLEPLEGAIEFSGGATVMLEPLALRGVDFGFSGDLDVPGVGQIENVRGTIGQNPQNLPILLLTGEMGDTVTVRGTLVPLELQASGTGLELALPSLLIADSTLSADLTLRGEEGGVVVGGAITAEEVIIDPAARQGAAAQPASPEQAAAAPNAPVGGPAPAEGPAPVARPAPAVPDDRAAAADSRASAAQPAADEPEPLTDLPPIQSAIEQLEPDVEGALPATPTVAEAEAQGARNAMAAVRFDDLRITAPQRVLFSMNIASLEASLDLTLAGTAAQPRLSGEARALRGSLRFSGREFTVDRAVATFTQGRGVLPELDVAAHAEFEKTRVLAGSPDVEFAAPSDGSTFTVQLAFTGPVELEENGGIRFDIRPALSSDALVEVSGEGVGTGVRPLSEAELLSLITLGRIEFGSDLIGAGGIGGAVAQGALDTAVDLLVVGEIQNALREALGLDVVEIRTTAFSSLLGGEGAQPFGVSVRLGGYLNPELFASYRIGTADPRNPGAGFTNEVALQYGLGPLNLDVLGRLDFPAAGAVGDPRPELGVGVSYDFGRALSVDTGVTLSSERSVVSFGVALRW